MILETRYGKKDIGIEAWDCTGAPYVYQEPDWFRRRGEHVRLDSCKPLVHHADYYGAETFGSACDGQRVIVGKNIVVYFRLRERRHREGDWIAWCRVGERKHVFQSTFIRKFM